MRLLSLTWMKGKERLIVEWTDAHISVTSLSTNQHLQNRRTLSEQTLH